MTTRAVLAFIGAIITMTLAAGIAAAQTDGTVSPDLSGPCQVQAVINETGTNIDPSTSGGVYTVPISGSAAYEGSIAVEPEERAFDGRVWVVTPPGIPGFTLKSWQDNDGDNVSDAGSVTWDLPDITPRGVQFTVTGYHNDSGERCEGSITVKVEGGITDSPAGVASLVLTGLAGVGLLGAGIPKR